MLTIGTAHFTTNGGSANFYDSGTLTSNTWNFRPLDKVAYHEVLSGKSWRVNGVRVPAITCRRTFRKGFGYKLANVSDAANPFFTGSPVAHYWPT